jgi:tetratricopeptide (TPR) repeat protein
MTNTLRLALVLSLLVLAATATLASGQETTLASARQLYGSAAYDEALSMLDRLRAAAPPASADVLTVDQYRAFCLMALGRQADAVHAIEAVVVADPFFVPDEADVAPRVVSAFRDARRRLLPGVAQQRYLEAKSAYDRKDYAAAIEGFDVALRLAGAPDLAEAATQAPLSDVRVLAAGFRDLARAAAAPPPPPPPQPRLETPPPAAAPPPAPAPKPVKAFYTADDAGVTAPVVVTQRVPRWPANVPVAFMPRGKQAVVEIVIDERGAVEAAVIRQATTSVYDQLLLAEAKTWRYKPAMMDNAPVKFMKMVQITLQ